MIPNDLYLCKLTCPFVFLNKREVLSRFSEKFNIFKYFFPRARHILMTFELWTLCARLCIFSLYISHLLLSSLQASIDMWTILIYKSWWWLLKPKYQRRLYIIIYSPIWIMFIYIYLFNFFIQKIWRSPVTFFVFLKTSKMRKRIEINL